MDPMKRTIIKVLTTAGTKILRLKRASRVEV